jgi:hypothetical protein
MARDAAMRFDDPSTSPSEFTVNYDGRFATSPQRAQRHRPLVSGELFDDTCQVRSRREESDAPTPNDQGQRYVLELTAARESATR